ncbi:hypothetical protein CBS101457_005570 [Exobasidium rhododendri]|nr:hypothetical protein CBS101457_005570 [Exobasidium rhododendri]
MDVRMRSIFHDLIVELRLTTMYLGTAFWHTISRGDTAAARLAYLESRSLDFTNYENLAFFIREGEHWLGAVVCNPNKSITDAVFYQQKLQVRKMEGVRHSSSAVRVIMKSEDDPSAFSREIRYLIAKGLAEGTVLAIFDSQARSSRHDQKYLEVVKRFLFDVGRERHPNVIKDESQIRVQLLSVTSPLLQNVADSGIYALYALQKFCADPQTFRRKVMMLDDRSATSWKKAWEPESMTRLRLWHKTQEASKRRNA